MPKTARIAIVGAGPAGLTLARLLQVAQVDLEVTLYELDASPTSRKEQGGTLDLHEDTGLLTLRKCNLWQEFQQYARYEGEEMIMVDKNATRIIHMKGGSNRPEIDRRRLREILLKSLPPDCIRWGRKLKEVTEDRMLRFDGIEAMDGPFDLIVGADGAWSKVRNQLSTIKPVYSGVSGFEADILEPSKTCAHIDKMVGRGSYFGTSDGCFLNVQRMGDDSLKIRSWNMCKEGEPLAVLEKLGKQGTLDSMMQSYTSWSPEITEVWKHVDLSTLRHWTLYELPVGSQWEHKEGFTLVGDASSLMTPFAGEGVNKAMKDALELADLIVESQAETDVHIFSDKLDQAVNKYEKNMFPRAKRSQGETMNNKVNIFGPGAPIALITGMIQWEARQSPSIIMTVLASTPIIAVIHSFFWLRMKFGALVRMYWRRN